MGRTADVLLMPFSDRVERRTIGPHDRGFLVFIGAILAAVGILQALDPSAREELFLGWFWPLWWTATGASCVLYAFRPWSSNLHAFSGAAFSLSCVGRSAQLAIALLAGDVPSDRVLRTVSGVLIYAAFGRLANRQWRTLMPVPRDGRARP